MAADDEDSTPSITLYRLHSCPYCSKVVNALQQHDLPYRSKFVEPLHSKRNIVKSLTGTRTVPAIVDEKTGVVMSESENIIDYIRAKYGDCNDE